MRTNARSATGVLLMLGILPILAGLLACMPEYVPLGNPDRAKIDPAMSGIWYTRGDVELTGNLVMLQPWDKRTWLIVNVILDEADDFDLEDVDFSDVDISTYEGFLKLLKTEGVDEDSFKIDAVVYKAWLVKLGGERFFTWELRGVPNDEAEPVNIEPWFWYDFRVDVVEDDRIALRLIDPTFEPLDGAPKTRRAWEKIIRKHVDDESLYSDETIEFRRVQEEDLELVTMLFFEAFIDE